ncbi:MAG TPA: MFS transporter [Burkholderiales bacterium]|nr:MFS transporter [Burkholderiales bacterium]
MRRVFYGWVVVAAAFTLMFVGFGAAYSFAAFFAAFQSDFSASRGHVSLLFSVAAFLWFSLGAPGGLLADRLGPRRVALAGVACLVAALACASVARSIEALYLTYSVGIGVGVGLTYVPSVGAVQPWFTRNRAFASGLAVAGIGAGNFLVPLLATWFIGLFGWRSAYQALALLVLVLGGTAALAIDDDPARHGAPGAARTERMSLPGATLGEALRSRSFWLLYVAGTLACVGLFVPMVHLASYAQDAGYSRAEGVALVSLIGLGSLAGRFTIGAVADRLGRLPSLALMYAGLGSMLVVWSLSTAYSMLALFALLFGAFYGGFVALSPTLMMDLYGPRAVSGIIGVLYTGPGIGTLVGPPLAGAAFDAFGSYRVPILSGAALSFVAVGFVLVLIRRTRAAAPA